MCVQNHSVFNHIFQRFRSNNAGHFHRRPSYGNSQQSSDAAENDPALLEESSSSSKTFCPSSHRSVSCTAPQPIARLVCKRGTHTDEEDSPKTNLHSNLLFFFVLRKTLGGVQPMYSNKVTPLSISFPGMLTTNQWIISLAGTCGGMSGSIKIKVW